MAKRIADLTCPECQKPISVPFEIKEPPTLDEINNSLNELLKGQPGTDEIQRVIQEQLTALRPPKEEHKHKGADELFDCPECRLWFDQTAKRYQVTEKEPEKAPPAEPAFGSVFKSGEGD